MRIEPRRGDREVLRKHFRAPALINDPYARTKFHLLWLSLLACVLAPITMGFFINRWYMLVAYIVWMLGWAGALMYSLGVRITR